MSEDKTYLFEVPDAVNTDAMYKNRMLRLAEELGILINPDYYNALNRVDQPNDMSEHKYIDLRDKWNKIKSENSLLDFMRKNFTEINYVRM